MLNLEEITDYTIARLHLYQLFSVIFNQQPSTQLAEDVCKVFNLKPTFLWGINPTMNKGIYLLYRFSREVEEKQISEVNTSLNVDWLRLFRGIQPDYGLPPARASAYIHYDIHSLVECYARAGLISTRPQFEPDYAGVQLAFLYRLVSQELNYWNAKEQIQALEILTQENKFITEHLSWITELCSQGVRHSKTYFYQGILFLLREFLRYEQLWLDECSYE